MRIGGKAESFLLLVGDILALAAALWITLVVRTREVFPVEEFRTHLGPFLIVFALWIFVYFLSDLYANQTLAFRRRLFATLLKAQLTGSGIAVIFFYFIPYFVITPKTILFLNLIFSLLTLLAWRVYCVPLFYRGRMEAAALVGESEVFRELSSELGGNEKYHLRLISGVSLQKVKENEVSMVIVDFKDTRVRQSYPVLYELLLSGVRILDVRDLYERIFDRVALAHLDEGWLIDNVSNHPKPLYDFFKRLMDISISILIGIPSLLLYPFVYIAVKCEDRGALMSFQTRTGQHGRLVQIMKFRTMSLANDGGAWGNGTPNTVTQVGKFLRRTRIDELPQLWNVLRGDISLIGPRPEFPEAVREYEARIPYYKVRHMLKPGLSGWAQIYHERHPHHAVAVEETKEKLSYDLYYVKHRSVWLDIKIALRTIRTLISIAGV